MQAAHTAVEVAGALFEVSGTRSARNSPNLHRHWRDARTHTLHDPTRWKIQHICRYVLGGTRLPRHGIRPYGVFFVGAGTFRELSGVVAVVRQLSVVRGCSRPRGGAA